MLVGCASFRVPQVSPLRAEELCDSSRPSCCQATVKRCSGGGDPVKDARVPTLGAGKGRGSALLGVGEGFGEGRNSPIVATFAGSQPRLWGKPGLVRFETVSPPPQRPQR